MASIANESSQNAFLSLRARLRTPECSQQFSGRVARSTHLEGSKFQEHLQRELRNVLAAHLSPEKQRDGSAAGQNYALLEQLAGRQLRFLRANAPTNFAGQTPSPQRGPVCITRAQQKSEISARRSKARLTISASSRARRWGKAPNYTKSLRSHSPSAQNLAQTGKTIRYLIAWLYYGKNLPMPMRISNLFTSSGGRACAQSRRRGSG